MGRRSGGGGGFRSASPRASAPLRRSAPAPPPPNPRSAPPPPPSPPARQGPGLMGQMAAMAGGVAIGSAVGHTVGNMMTGGGHRGEEIAPATQNDQAAYGQGQQQAQKSACEFEWRQFIECSQNMSDLSMCQSLNEAFKQCQTRSRYA